MMRFAGLLLDAGGLAVKVETAGVAHGPSTWRELLALALPRLAVFHGLTVRVETAKYTYSCGMQHAALPDARVPQPGQRSLLDAFNKYVLFQQPELADGRTFSVGREAPRYRLRHEPCVSFPAGDLFHNPYGVWTLSPI